MCGHVVSERWAKHCTLIASLVVVNEVLCRIEVNAVESACRYGHANSQKSLLQGIQFLQPCERRIFAARVTGLDNFGCTA